MPDPKFAHLHVHTHYSLLDGANKIPELVKQAKKLGMDSLAITDHGCMFGVVEFFNECKKEGIKPILGMEAYMAPGDRRDRSGQPGETAYHLLLLAQNLEGYHNLLKLSSRAYREGFYYKPRIDKDILREHQAGLIATSACLGGEIPSAFMKRQKMAEAKAVAETYLDIFGPDRFFIEVQNHIKEQNEVNPELAELAKKTGIGLVATNDVHFLTAEDHRAHDVLCCISMGRLVSDENRLKYPTQLYLKSPAEMQAALGDFDQAIENTTRIAARCNLELDFSKRFAPVYRVPAEKLDEAIIPPGLPAATLKPHPTDVPPPIMRDDERYMRQLCETGLLWRYGTREVSQAVRDRLEYEITVIAAKNFCSYFLIVWDFCNFARDNGIPVGARGSGVGCMVAYLLGLCNVDPIEYGLLFERFMDPSRNEMPDIDIDICQDGRQRVIEYVRQKYGHVAQIITFGTLAAKAACKDVGRVLGVPLPEIDKLTKLIPGIPGTTLTKALKQVPELSQLYSENPQTKQVIDLALKLEGMCRNAGCHAAGVIIADQPLDGIVPLYRDKDDNVLTQFEGPIAEKCGLLKMDFLGLRTLSTLTRSLDLEKMTRDHRPVRWLPQQPLPPMDENDRLDIEKIDLADPAVFKLFQRGETRGVFQFESGGMQDLLMKMVPDRINDLIAANALYRPGPMELIPSYCARKHGKEPVPQVHPIMDAILAETYGIMCIHEDVRVSMADGSSKPIQFVRRGDLVWSLNYATSAFEVKECHGCGPTRFGGGVRITLVDGSQVTLTSDHKVYTAEGMKEAGALDIGSDWVAVDARTSEKSFRARLSSTRSGDGIVGFVENGVKDESADAGGEYPSRTLPWNVDGFAGGEELSGEEPALTLAVPLVPPPTSPSSWARHAPCCCGGRGVTARNTPVDRRTFRGVVVARRPASHGTPRRPAFKTSVVHSTGGVPWPGGGGPGAGTFATARVRDGSAPSTTQMPAQRSSSVLGGAGGEAACVCDLSSTASSTIELATEKAATPKVIDGVKAIAHPSTIWFHDRSFDQSNDTEDASEYEIADAGGEHPSRTHPEADEDGFAGGEVMLGAEPALTLAVAKVPPPGPPPPGQGTPPVGGTTGVMGAGMRGAPWDAGRQVRTMPRDVRTWVDIDVAMTPLPPRFQGACLAQEVGGVGGGTCGTARVRAGSSPDRFSSPAQRSSSHGRVREGYSPPASALSSSKPFSRSLLSRNIAGSRKSFTIGHVRYVRIASIERVDSKQFYGMSVADHHNLVGNGVVIKNCYQEQVMQVFNQLGGIELSNAYKLIKAISKKNSDIIGKFKPDFLKGTMDKGVPKDKAEEIFDFILKFGGYGFNKSHSTRYAIVAYQTAYMKTYHPVEYMSALLTFEMGSTEKVVEYIEECRRMTLVDGSRGIGVLPPDVNVSDKDFTPVYVAPETTTKKKSKLKPKAEGTIRFGLAAVRGVGEKAVEAISDERKARGDFTSLYDFCERMDLRAVTRSTIEALIKCGAFSSLKAKRAQLLQIVDRAVEMGQQSQNDKRSGQMAMFGGPVASGPSAAQAMGSALPDVEEIDNADLLKFEKELLGFYITSHPLTEHQIAIERYTTASTKEAMAMGENTEVTVGGMISRVKKVVTKNGRSAGMPMAIITMEDLDGQIDGTMFAETYAEVCAKYPDAVKGESIVFVRGKVDRKRETPSLLINEVIPVADAVARLTTAVALKLEPTRHTEADLVSVPGMLARHKGAIPVYFQINTPTGKVTLSIDRQHAVKPSADLVGDIEHLLGPDSVDLAGAGAKRKKRLEQQRLFGEDTEAAPTGGPAMTDGDADAVAALDREEAEEL